MHQNPVKKLDELIIQNDWTGARELLLSLKPLQAAQVTLAAMLYIDRTADNKDWELFNQNLTAIYPPEDIPTWCQMPDQGHYTAGGCWGILHGQVITDGRHHCKNCEYYYNDTISIQEERRRRVEPKSAQQLFDEAGIPNMLKGHTINLNLGISKHNDEHDDEEERRGQVELKDKLTLPPTEEIYEKAMERSQEIKDQIDNKCQDCGQPGTPRDNTATEHPYDMGTYCDECWKPHEEHIWRNW